MEIRCSSSAYGSDRSRIKIHVPVYVWFCSLMFLHRRNVNAFAIHGKGYGIKRFSKCSSNSSRNLLRRSTYLNANENEEIVNIAEEKQCIGVGIDLGTTNSCAAVLHDGVPTIIPFKLEDGNNKATMPSVVCLNAPSHGKGTDSKLFDILKESDGCEVSSVYVGQEAIDAHLSVLQKLESQGIDTSDDSFKAMADGSWTYRNFKRIMGVGCTSAAMNAFGVVPNLHLKSANSIVGKQKKKRLEHLSLGKKLEEASINPAKLKFGETSFMPETISGLVLQKIFDSVEAHFDEKIDRAIIGVPAYFNDAQRSATIRACELAGVTKVKLLREPEAAALAYGVGKDQAARAAGRDKDTDDELVLVFDLGGGTFDVSILEVGGGIMEVVATGGNNMLGGSDFDARIADFFAETMTKNGAKNFLKRAKSTIEDGKVASSMINSAEAVRIFLSNNKVAALAIPLSAKGWLEMEYANDIIIKSDEDLEKYATQPNYVLCELSRKEFERICEKEFQSLLRPIREVALLAQAMLPGDARPSVVENALKFEEEYQKSLEQDGTVSFSNFFSEEGESVEQTIDGDIDKDTSNMLLEAVEVLDAKALKKKQQKGRKKARSLAVREKSFRQEKRLAAEKASSSNGSDSNIKVRDGFGGRPISQVVLVGGATRMPAVGRLLAAMTGIIPQRTVNPDEAVALGCAIQVGLLDGDESVSGVVEVMTPMQAAIMRAMAQKRGVRNDEDMDLT